MAELITLARPYAKAAFAQAREDGKLAAWGDALVLAAGIAAEPRVREHVLGNPLVEAESAAAFFIEVGKFAFDARFSDFIRLLAVNRRLGLLPQVAGLYARYRADAEQTLTVSVHASAAFSDEQKTRLAKALEQRFGRRIDLAVRVDESLLGGAVIYAGDTVIDGSLKSKLARLSTAMAH